MVRQIPLVHEIFSGLSLSNKSSDLIYRVSLKFNMLLKSRTSQRRNKLIKFYLNNSINNPYEYLHYCVFVRLPLQ